MPHKHLLVAAWAIALLATFGSTNAAQTGCVPEDFTASAVDRGENGIDLAFGVNIHIARWSTEAQKDRFARTLLDRGPAALREALSDADRVGLLDTPNALPYDFQFAWQEPLEDGGRRIVLIGDRAMFAWKEDMGVEEDGATFTVVEIRLGPDGNGDGKIAVGSHAVVNRSLDLIELKNFDAEPVRLRNVHALSRQT